MRDDPTDGVQARLVIRPADDTPPEVVQAVVARYATVDRQTEFDNLHATADETAVAELLQALPDEVAAVETRVAVADETGVEE